MLAGGFDMPSTTQIPFSSWNTGLPDSWAFFSGLLTRIILDASNSDTRKAEIKDLIWLSSNCCYGMLRFQCYVNVAETVALWENTNWKLSCSTSQRPLWCPTFWHAIAETTQLWLLTLMMAIFYRRQTDSSGFFTSTNFTLRLKFCRIGCCLTCSLRSQWPINHLNNHQSCS